MAVKDRYLYFTFNGIESSRYRCFYENSGEDLSFPAFPSFSNNITAPLYQTHSYFLGTSISNKVFNLRCAAEELTMNEFKQLQRWLDIETIGTLKFDFMPYYHYIVKVESFSNVLFMPLDPYERVFHIEFDLAFTTVEDAAAISDFLYNFNANASSTDVNMLDVEYRLPVIDLNPNSEFVEENNEANHRVRIFNPQVYSCYPKITISDVNFTQIDLFANKYHKIINDLKYPLASWYRYDLRTDEDTRRRFQLEIDSRYGYAINKETNEFIERDFMNDLQKQNSFINNGSFEVESGNIKQNLLTLESVRQYSYENKNGVELIFTSLEPFVLDEYDFGRIENNLILENNNFKGIFIQNVGFDDYLLYNEDGYNEGFYYVNKQYTFYSYHFIVEDSHLRVVLLNLGQSYTDIARFIEYFRERQGREFIVSICDYTEIDFHSYYFQDETSSTPALNNVSFNLRTVF